MKHKLTPEDKKQVLDMIEQVDKTLSMLKEGRDEAKAPELKKRWTERIDAMLDERMRLMNARDGKEIKI
jgi:hypothetical protein